MKVMIGQSYFRVLDPKELERNMPYPPLGALYAAAILKEQKHEIIFCDSMLCSSPDVFTKMIKEEKPGLLLIYDDEFNYLTKMCLSNMRNAAIEFIKTAKAKDIPVVIYSSDATDFPASYLQTGCDAIIYGEGEITLQEVIQSLENNSFEKSKHEINGLKFLSGGKIFSTPPRKLMYNLDTLPDPDFSFVDIEAYRDIWLNNHGYFSLNISTTRGCPYKCNWCDKPLYGQTYSTQSPARTVFQLKSLKERYSVDHVWMTDDIFGLKPNWIKEFSNELKRQEIKIPYKCLSRPDLLVKGNTINDLAESGCRTIWIGAESGSQGILDAMDKGTFVGQIYEAANLTHQAGMEIAFFVQFGYLGESWSDIKLTRQMIKDCLPDDIGISVSYPLPGTKFYDRVKEIMKEKTNWTDSDDLDPMLTGTYSKLFYKSLHRFVHAEYRLYKIINSRKLNKAPQLVKQLLKLFLYRIKLIMYKKYFSYE